MKLRLNWNKRLLTLVFVVVSSAAFSQEILDEDSLFSQPSEKKIFKEIEKIKTTNGLDILIITTSNYWPYTSPEEYLSHKIKNKENTLILLISRDIKKVELISSDSRLSEKVLLQMKNDWLLPSFIKKNYTKGIHSFLKDLEEI